MSKFLQYDHHGSIVSVIHTSSGNAVMYMGDSSSFIEAPDESIDDSVYINEYHVFGGELLNDKTPQPLPHSHWSQGGWVFDIDSMLDDLRRERDARLAACDWVVLPDAQGISGPTLDAWLAYRQELRDFPSTIPTPFNIDDVIWPEVSLTEL